MTNLQLIILTIVGWGLGSIFYKIANDTVHPTVMLGTISAAYALLTVLSIFVFEGTCTFSVVGFIVASLGSLAMSIATFAFMHLLQKGGAGEMTAMVSVYPALTFLISCIFLHEEVTFKKIAGCMLALFGVYLLGH